MNSLYREENKKNMVIVAHPYKQHSHQLATALKNSGRLFMYCTTAYDKEHTFLHFFKSFCSPRFKNLISKKNCGALDEKEVTVFCELSGFIFLVMARLPVLNRWYRQFGRWLNGRFGRKVAKLAIKNGVGTVVMYDTTACACFSYLKKHAPHIKCVLDVSSNASAERLKLYDSIVKRDPESQLREEFSYLWDEGFQRRNLSEIKDSDYFIVPSSFSKNSIQAQNVKPESIYVVPYGVNNRVFKYSRKEFVPDKKLRFVYTGVVSYEKGVNYLLETFMKLPQNECELYLMGVYDTQSPIYRKYCGIPNIQFMGYVTHDVLAEIYAAADVFVMASLGEGFTLSGLEAMSCGLPVICSTHTGINDIIVNYENGIVFDVCDNTQLLADLQWMIDHKEKIPAMAQNAYETSLKYTWNAYYKNCSDVFDQIIQKN